ncbi:Leucyl aminopeptidase yscIV [Arthrobotrys conoides]|uniref:Peptide hydrolase n=1 Tax=Arthrobotrys conoides TaxID=74498 RepID=A0AAN8N933_9PEZI
MKTQSFILPILASCHLIAAVPTLQLVESNKLRRILTISNLKAQAAALMGIATRNNGNREVGTPGDSESIDWVYNQIPTDHYNVEIQNFTFPLYHSDDAFIVDGGNVAAFCYSEADITTPITKTAELVLITGNGCQASDFAGAAGKIGIMSAIRTSSCAGEPSSAFRDRVRTAGVLGLISLTNVEFPDGILTPGPSSTLRSRQVVDPLVLCLLYQPRAQAIFDKLAPGSPPISTTIRLHRWYEDVSTANIIATTKAGNQNSVILASASLDSYATSPGMNDNGSGTIALLEIAKAFTGFSTNNAVRFCWWGGSSPGLAGSRYYLSQLSAADKAKIVMNLNGYMLGSKNFIYGVTDGDGSAGVGSVLSNPASGIIEGAFNDFFNNEENKPSVPIPVGGASDHYAFFEEEIPAGGITTGSNGRKTPAQAGLFGGTAGEHYDTCYLKACDDVSNLNFRVFLTGTKAMAHVIAKYARDITGFPFPRS